MAVEIPLNQPKREIIMTKYKLGYYVEDHDYNIEYFDTHEAGENYILTTYGTYVGYCIFVKHPADGEYYCGVSIRNGISEGEAQDFIDELNGKGKIYLAA